jgi:epoxyqueuosine reductase QueG
MNSVSQSDLEHFILRKGADLVGFADMNGHLPIELERLSCGISIAIRLSDIVIDDIARGPIKIYSKLYQTTNKRLDQIARDAILELEDSGFETYLEPASRYPEEADYSISHKMVATLGGLGWIGKSNLLITPQYGPRVRFVSILTDAPFATAQPITNSDCSDCTTCIDSCPVGALKGVNWAPGIQTCEMIDLEKCRSYISRNEQRLNVRVCGICMGVCRKGTKRTRRSSGMR